MNEQKQDDISIQQQGNVGGPTQPEEFKNGWVDGIKLWVCH